MPKDWHFQASDDNETWKTLDTRTDQTWISGQFNYAFVNTEQFRYYQYKFMEGHLPELKIRETQFIGY
jgi:hypothetical protein